jgi:hypothetical protein
MGVFFPTVDRGRLCRPGSAADGWRSFPEEEFASHTTLDNVYREGRNHHLAEHRWRCLCKKTYWKQAGISEELIVPIYSNVVEWISNVRG